MSLNFEITLSFHYGGKFEKRDKKIHYIGEIGCNTLSYPYEKLSIATIRKLLRDDCKYEGNIEELWWKTFRIGSELRRIIGDKEVVDMAPKLVKCKIMHVYVLDKPSDNLMLPFVVHNFVDTNYVISRNNLSDHPPSSNLERSGKANMGSISRKPIGSSSEKQQPIRRSLFHPRQSGDKSTPTNGMIGFMATSVKGTTKAKYVAPGSLTRGRFATLKANPCPKSPVPLKSPTQNVSPKGLGLVSNNELHDGGGAAKDNEVLPEEDVNRHVPARSGGDVNQGVPLGLNEPLPEWLREILQGNSTNNTSDERLNVGQGSTGAPSIGSRTEGDSLGEMGNSATLSNSDPLKKTRKRSINWKPRGRNKVRKVAALRPGQKLDVIFYNKGPVGDNRGAFSTHVGKLVRDRNMLPVKVHSWNEIDGKHLDKLWDAIVDKFTGIENARFEVMRYAKGLWQNWRGEMKQLHLKQVSDIKDALKQDNIPKAVVKEDWEWLVLEHYTDPDVHILSVRNSENRANLTMQSRTGSKPIRQIIYEDLGGKDGKEPSLSEVFMASRLGKARALNELDQEVYDEIVENEKQDPPLSTLELVELSFGPQEKGHVTCFGYGVTPRTLRGPTPSKVELRAQVQEKDKLIRELTARVEKIEADNEKVVASQRRDIDKLYDHVQKLSERICPQGTDIPAPSSPTV